MRAEHELVEKFTQLFTLMLVKDGRDEFGVLLHVHQRQVGKDRILVRIVLVECPDADLRLARDVIRRDFFEGMTVQKASSRFENLLPCSLRTRLLRDFPWLYAILHGCPSRSRKRATKAS